ncbi:hypothetical protein [Nonomuraea sp. NPDC005650]|uniref:hypothetical protein n=1 Tax=Nonomuraea sp. NPDC005650 TaxID=3157045 RepID=UPI0033B65EDB
MRNTLITVCALLALAGCSSPQPSPSGDQGSHANASTSATARAEPAAAGIPSPDALESAQLLDALALVDPALDHKRSISRARDTCQSILAGGDQKKLLSAVRQRFDGTASISTADAAVIVQVIQDSGWCRR